MWLRQTGHNRPARVRSSGPAVFVTIRRVFRALLLGNRLPDPVQIGFVPCCYIELDNLWNFIGVDFTQCDPQFLAAAGCRLDVEAKFLIASKVALPAIMAFYRVDVDTRGQLVFQQAGSNGAGVFNAVSGGCDQAQRVSHRLVPFHPAGRFIQLHGVSLAGMGGKFVISQPMNMCLKGDARSAPRNRARYFFRFVSPSTGAKNVRTCA